MFDRVTMSRAACTALALSCFLSAGCAGVKHAQTTAPVPAAPPAASIPVAEAPAKAAPETMPAAAAPETVPAPAARAAVPSAPVATAPATMVAPPKPAPKPAAAVAAAPADVPAPPVMPKAAAVPATPQLAPAPLDFKALATRLRQTKAIGVLTKIALKNQVDDLVEKFRAYHKRQGSAKLADLRRNYDMLLLKVLSLLQDSDPPLARDIVKSRSAIWSILEDPRKFTESNLMAGATP